MVLLRPGVNKTVPRAANTQDDRTANRAGCMAKMGFPDRENNRLAFKQLAKLLCLNLALIFILVAVSKTVRSAQRICAQTLTYGSSHGFGARSYKLAA